MKKPLQVLIVEDNPVDAKLVLAELRAAGFEPTWKRVETEVDFLAELENSPDIVLSDYSMPEFSGMRAAELLQASGREIPFILISGTVGEEVAVEAMKHGATDYLLKDRITRLGSAVERALREARANRERQQTEGALRESEKEFRNLAEAMPQIVWVTRPDGENIYTNPQWTDYTGLSRDESFGYGWLKSFHPDDQQRAWDAWQKGIATVSECSLESRLRRADGTYRWWLVRGVPVQDDAGQILKWFGTCTDIHDLKLAELEITRANRALRLLSASNEALIRAEAEQELLERICRIAAETGGYCMAWVGYAQDDEALSIKPMAYAGAEEGYFSEIKISWSENDPLGQGPAGQVIRTGRAVFCPDFTDDPALTLWHSAARRRGFRGVTLLPLNNGQRTFGLLGLYTADVNAAGADEAQLLQKLAANLAFGIVHLRARLDQQRLQTAVLQVAAGVSGASGTEFFEHFARHMADAVGAQAGVVLKINEGDPLSASTLVAVVDGKVVENFECLIEGSPCANLATTDSFVVAQGAAEKFPQSRALAALRAQSYVGRRLEDSTGHPLGILFVVFREPLKDVEFVTSTLRIFAARAASELERQQTDAQVHEQAALIDEARDAIVVRDLDDRITFWSKGAERLYGWSAEDARGRLSQELLEIDPATFAEADRAVRESGAWNGEIQKRNRSQTLLTLSGRWTLMRDADGQPRSILSIDTDITEQKKIEEQFLRAQRMESIGTLAGGIAHDLNNALSPIMMSLEMLSLRFPDPRSTELLSVLSTSAKHGADMVRQVLSFARGIEGRRMEVQVSHLIQEIERITNDTFLKHIQVRSVVPDELWTVVGDPTQIHQVLLNLCVNARDAMPGGGTLTLSAENRILDAHYAALNLEANAGPYVYLKIEDTGTGMPPAVIEKIFDPFFTTKEVGLGTGLGLSTSLAIIKSHGGFVRVYSEPGNGTTFKVYLPAQTEFTAETAANIDAELPWGHGELILVVDDEVSVRVITQATLEAFGYRVLLACDGAEAVALYGSRSAEIAAVITDMTMPVMDGSATIQVLKKIDPDVRIIAASGLTLSGEVARACGLDLTHFIPKPYTAGILLRVLRQVLTGEL